MLCKVGSELSVTRFCKSLSARSVKPRAYKPLIFSIFVLYCPRFLLLSATCSVAPCPKSLLLFVTSPDVLRLLRLATDSTPSIGPTLPVSGLKTCLIVLTNFLAGDVYLRNLLSRIFLYFLSISLSFISVFSASAMRSFSRSRPEFSSAEAGSDFLCGSKVPPKDHAFVRCSAEVSVTLYVCRQHCRCI